MVCYDKTDDLVMGGIKNPVALQVTLTRWTFGVRVMAIRQNRSD